MAQENVSTTSAFEDKHGNQNIEMYAKAMAAVKQYYDPSKGTGVSVNAYSREMIRGYLQNPASNETNLRSASQYLYIRSQIYYRLCHWYADMWDLRCRKITPNYNLNKENDPDKMLKEYSNTLKILDGYNLQNNWSDVALRCYVEDVCYAIFFRDGDSSIFYILNPSECKIDGRYLTGDFSYSVDMSKWKSANKRQQAEWLGEPLVGMLKEYDETGNRWIHMPDEYAACFKFNSDRPDLVLPPLVPILQSISALNDVADLQAIKDEASVYKLLLIPMEVLKNANGSDEFEISPDLLIAYYNILKEMLPDYVASAVIPGKVTNDNVVDFSTTSVDKDVDRLAQSQDTLLATSGGGAVLNSSAITSTAAFNAWLKAESEFAISSLLPQVQGFTNRMLNNDMNKPCKVEYFEVTVYTKQDLADGLLTLCQHSFSDRLALQTLYGFTEKDTMAMEYFETQVLKLPELMNHPLQSTYTTSGSDEGGAPTKDDDEITIDGDRSRNR